MISSAGLSGSACANSAKTTMNVNPKPASDGVAANPMAANKRFERLRQAAALAA